MGRNSFLLDSNVLIGLLDKNDRLHQRVKSVLVSLKEKKPVLIIHPLVYIETLTILKYKQRQEGNISFVECKRKLDNIRVWSHISWSGISQKCKGLKFFQADNNLGLIDAILIQECLDNNYGLITFDGGMEKVWKRLKGRRPD